MVAAPSLVIRIADQKAKEIRTFSSFAERFSAHWQRCHCRRELVTACGELSLAMVLWAIWGTRSSEWLNGPLLVLNGHTPAELLSIEEGRRALKGLLLESNIALDVAYPRRVRPISRILRPLDRVCQIEPLVRDVRWLTRLYGALTGADLAVDLANRAKLGDERATLSVFSDPPSSANLLVRCSFGEACRRAIDSGLGITLNPHKPLPDCTVSPGEVSCFLDNGFLALRVGTRANHDEWPGYIGVALPQIEPLSESVRPFMRSFMRRVLGVTEPRAASFIDSDGGTRLVVNLLVERFGDAAHYEEALSQLAWFVPAACIVCGISALDPALRTLPLI